MEPDERSVTFRPGDPSRNTQDACKFPLTYDFRATRSKHYGIVLDITTHERKEHNDVWAGFFDGVGEMKGFQLLQHGAEDLYADKYIKVFHNENGRAAFSKTVNGMWYSISTGISLKKGRKYSLVVCGRSTQVTLHQVLLLPCKREDCRRAKWRGRQERCLPGSTNWN